MLSNRYAFLKNRKRAGPRNHNATHYPPRHRCRRRRRARAANADATRGGLRGLTDSSHTIRTKMWFESVHRAACVCVRNRMSYESLSSFKFSKTFCFISVSKYNNPMLEAFSKDDETSLLLSLTVSTSRVCKFGKSLFGFL